MQSSGHGNSVASTDGIPDCPSTCPSSTQPDGPPTGRCEASQSEPDSSSLLPREVGRLHRIFFPIRLLPIKALGVRVPAKEGIGMSSEFQALSRWILG